jgi:hypothetical protein
MRAAHEHPHPMSPGRAEGIAAAGCRTICRLLLAATVLSAALAGCISRTIEVRSDPPGARVYLDGEEMGRTPVSRPFLEYGSHRLLVAREEHEPVSEVISLTAPWWCWFPFDLFVELWPAKVVDTHEFAYALAKSGAPEANLDQLLDTMDKLRKKMSSEK